MIEERIREAFASRESEVPSSHSLVARIESAARRRQRDRWVWRGGAAMLAVALVAFGVPALMNRWTTAITGLPLAPLVGLPSGPLNFLIVGMDRLPQHEPQRPDYADAIVIAHVTADRSAIQLVTIPPDLRVDGTNGSPIKINAAVPYGGMALLEQRVSELTGVRLQGSAQVDLGGMTRLVDDLGGIDFCLDQKTTSWHTGRVYLPECRHRTAAEMRDLLRERKSYAQGPLDRDRHNAQFLAALAKQLGSAGYLTDLDAMRSAYGRLSRYVRLDTRGVNPVELLWQLRDATKAISYAAMQVRPCEPFSYCLGDNAASLFRALREDTVRDWITEHHADPLLQ